jgi:hypothetical protein
VILLYIVMGLFMLNFLLAIILDAYAVVKRRVVTQVTEQSILRDTLTIIFLAVQKTFRGWPTHHRLIKGLSKLTTAELTCEEIIAIVGDDAKGAALFKYYSGYEFLRQASNHAEQHDGRQLVDELRQLVQEQRLQMEEEQRSMQEQLEQQRLMQEQKMEELMLQLKASAMATRASPVASPEQPATHARPRRTGTTRALQYDRAASQLRSLPACQFKPSSRCVPSSPSDTATADEEQKVLAVVRAWVKLREQADAEGAAKLSTADIVVRTPLGSVRGLESGAHHAHRRRVA